MWTDTGKLGMFGITTAMYVLARIILEDGSS